MSGPERFPAVEKLASLNWPLLIDSLVSPSGAFKRGQNSRGWTCFRAELVSAYLRAGLVLNCPKHFKIGLVLRLAGGQSYIFRQSFVGQSYYKWLDFKIEAPKGDATIQEAPKRDAAIQEAH